MGIHEHDPEAERLLRERSELIRAEYAKYLAARGGLGFGDEKFDGQPIKVIYGATGRHSRVEFYYGGLGSPDGPGHGHVVSNDGENIHFWREPHSTLPIIDDRWSTEQLSKHGL